MQNLDNSLRLVRARRWFWPFGKGLTSRRDPGQPPIPAYIPVANQAARHIAERTGAFPSSSINEVVLNIPTTAHILGGASMGTSPEDGVIDARNRVFGYDNLYVVDGSMIPSNLGVNPSLTITAMAEHAMSHIAPKDPRRGCGICPSRPGRRRLRRRSRNGSSAEHQAGQAEEEEHVDAEEGAHGAAQADQAAVFQEPVAAHQQEAQKRDFAPQIGSPHRHRRPAQGVVKQRMPYLAAPRTSGKPEGTKTSTDDQ